MKKYIYTTIAIAATMFAACSSDDDIVTNNTNDQEFTIIAKLPESAMTRMAGTDESAGTTYSMKFDWQTTDQVRFYYYYNKNVSGTPTSTYDAFDRPINNTSTLSTDGFAQFNLGTRPGQSCYVYASWVNFSNSTLTVSDAAAATATVHINHDTRVYNSASDVANNNPMFGAVSYTAPSGNVNYNTQGTLNFKNVCALMKFSLTLPDVDGASISDVSIQQYNGSPAKAVNPVTRRYYTITGSTGVIAPLVDGSHAETKASGGYKVTGKSFAVTNNQITLYAIVHPQTWDGISIILKDSKNKTYTFQKTGSQTLETGKMYGVNVTKASSWTVTE